MKKSVALSFIFLFLFATAANVQAAAQIEIFDIYKGKVIKAMPAKEGIQEEIYKLLSTVTGLYPELEPIPDKGYMVKVPLEPPINLKNQWLDDKVAEVIVIFPEYENPHLMAFDSKSNTFFFTFNGSVDDFLTKIKFTPKPPQ